MENLPSEVLLIIFRKLTYDTLGRLRQTSKLVADFLEDKHFLKKYYREHIFRRPYDETKKNVKSFVQVHHAIFAQRKILILHKLLNQVLHIKVNKYAGDRIFISLNVYPSVLARQDGFLLVINKDRLMHELNIKG